VQRGAGGGTAGPVQAPPGVLDLLLQAAPPSALPRPHGRSRRHAPAAHYQELRSPSWLRSSPLLHVGSGCRCSPTPHTIPPPPPFPHPATTSDHPATTGPDPSHPPHRRCCHLAALYPPPKASGSGQAVVTTPWIIVSEIFSSGQTRDF
jgi:hypothetical protein